MPTLTRRGPRLRDPVRLGVLDGAGRRRPRIVRAATAARRTPEGTAARDGLLVRRPASWARGWEAHPATVPLRSDAYRNLLAVVWALVGEADADSTTAPTWSVLIERTGLSRSTVGKWLAWLHEHDGLRTVETGSTPELRHEAPSTGNRAAVYVLTVRPSPRPPLPVDGSRTPSQSPPGTTLGGPSPERGAAGQSLDAEGRRAVEVHRRSLDLRALDVRAVRATLRRSVPVAWSADDVLHAIDHAPDGTPWRFKSGTIKAPAAWARFRLTLWRGLPGPVTTRRAAVVEEAERRRAAQAVARVAAAAERSAAVPPPEVLDAARRRSRSAGPRVPVVESVPVEAPASLGAARALRALREARAAGPTAPIVEARVEVPVSPVVEEARRVLLAGRSRRRRAS